MQRKKPTQRPARMIALAVLYLLAALATSTLIHKAASPIWFPAGLALGSLVLFGRGLWPGVALGAAVYCVMPSPFGEGWPVWVAVAAGLAAALEAYLGATLLRMTGFDYRLQRARDLIVFFGVGALPAATISSLLVSGVLAMSPAVMAGGGPGEWWALMSGEAAGVVMVAPVMFSWLRTQGPPVDRRGAFWEAVALAIVTVWVSVVVFGPGRLPVTENWPFVLFPIAMWAALRFRSRGASLVLLSAGAVAAWGTLSGSGPFASGDLTLDVSRMQLFLTVLAGTALTLAAFVGERERYKTHLESLVAERTASLEAANTELLSVNAELLEATKAKSEFLTSMSHELRTPLNSVIGFSDIMLKGMTGDLNAEQEHQLGMIHSSGEHLLALVNDVLDLAKIEAGQATLEQEMYDAAKETRGLAESLRQLAESKGLVLDYSIPTQLEVCSDRRKVDQVLLNLIGNAVKFTSSGKIHVRVQEVDGSVLFSVSDTGPGIEQDDIDRIFDTFTQVDTVGRGRPEGTGLGLAVSRRLAEMLGGELRVSSVRGEGSTFTLAIPARDS